MVTECNFTPLIYAIGGAAVSAGLPFDLFNGCCEAQAGNSGGDGKGEAHELALPQPMPLGLDRLQASKIFLQLRALSDTSLVQLL